MVIAYFGCHGTNDQRGEYLHLLGKNIRTSRLAKISTIIQKDPELRLNMKGKFLNKYWILIGHNPNSEFWLARIQIVSSDCQIEILDSDWLDSKFLVLIGHKLKQKTDAKIIVYVNACRGKTYEELADLDIDSMAVAGSGIGSISSSIPTIKYGSVVSSSSVSFKPDNLTHNTTDGPRISDEIFSQIFTKLQHDKNTFIHFSTIKGWKN